VKVLVTGATGFIGAPIARALVEAGEDVVSLVRPSSERVPPGRIVHGDVEDPAVAATIAEVAPDVIVHAAWYVEPGKYLHSERNVEWIQHTVRLFDAAVKAGCKRFVGVGTLAEYADSEHALREDSALGPTTLYAASKLSTFLVLEQLAALRKVSFAWARVFHLYGPGEDERRFVPAVIRTMLRGEPFRTNPGGQVRDWSNVGDTGAAIAAVARSGVTGPVNIASGNGVTGRILCETIADLTGGTVEFGVQPYREGDPMHVLGDVTRLRDEVGFRSRHDLRSGLEDAVRWWRAR
jgi:nucleoside-diphosphate-sugar epimerase